MLQTDRLYIHQGNDKLLDDCSNCIQLQKRNYQHMDRHNVRLYKPNCVDIRNLSYIRVDNLVRAQDNLANMNKQLFHQPIYIGCLGHTARAHSQQLVWFQLEDDLNTNNWQSIESDENSWSKRSGTNWNAKIFLRCSSFIHLTNGSPVKPKWQLQIGLWFTTVQREFNPQTFSHGFLHFWLIQDLSSGHSELTKHSGRQFGGAPIISGKQLHTAWLSSSRHCEFNPQGDGVQGISCGSCSTKNFQANIW